MPIVFAGKESPMKLKDPQHLLESKKFFEDLQKAYDESIMLANDFEDRIRRIMVRLPGEELERRMPLFNMAAAAAIFIKEEVKDRERFQDPATHAEWKVNHQLTVAMAGAIFTFTLMGTRQSLQTAEVMMSLADKFIKLLIIQEGRFHA
jgi:hypothetical protein